MDFVRLAGRDGTNLSELCRRFGVSRKTGYKWLGRYAEFGEAGLIDRSRRPLRSPRRTASAVEQAVIAVRCANPAWGGRKIRQYLLNEAVVAAAVVPAASTISGILRRHDLMRDPAAPSRRWKRFEADAPNRLWQMDFKGHFALDGRGDGGGARCWPLTVLDDHSRYSLAVEACQNEREPTVRERLTAVFRRYGLPDAIITDNGPPWGHSDAASKFTRFSVWLMQLGVKPLHSRPRHPQTLGKIERMHRAMKAELLQNHCFPDFHQAQHALQRWRHHYNHKRPHQALGGEVPASRYSMSPRSMPAKLRPPDYPSGDITARIRNNGCLRCKLVAQRSVDLQLSAAFAKQLVAVRPARQHGLFHVWFADFCIAQVDCTTNPKKPTVTHLFERL